MLKNVLESSMESYSLFTNEIVPKWECTCCTNVLKSNNGEFIIQLNHQTTDREINNLVEMNYNSLKEAHLNDQIVHESNFDLVLQSYMKSCIFHSSEDMKVNLNSIIQFGGKSWKCTGAISHSYKSFFKVKNNWFVSTEKTKEIELCKDVFIRDIAVAIYDEINIIECIQNESLCYIGKDNQKIQEKIPTRRKDRHTSQKDRHIETPKRKEHDSEDRHILTPKRKQHDYERLEKLRNETIKKEKQNYHRNKKEEEFLNDTGMDIVCCCCVELKSEKSCTRADKIPPERMYKYCTESDLTRNKDNKFYVCNTCKVSIQKNVEPRRSQKEIYGLLNFPHQLMEELEKCCTRSIKESEDPAKKYLQLNRVEDFLLKPAIPFIRFSHLPRGRYFQLKGDLIMVSAV